MLIWENDDQLERIYCVIAGNARFKGIPAGLGVGFTTDLLLLRERALGCCDPEDRACRVAQAVGVHSWHGGDAPGRGGRRWSGWPCAGRHEETPGADEGSGGLSRLGEGDVEGEVGGMGAFAVRWYPPSIRGDGFDYITSRGACASRSASRPFSTRGGSRR